jgi:hypothetical protein
VASDCSDAQGVDGMTRFTTTAAASAIDTSLSAADAITAAFKSCSTRCFDPSRDIALTPVSEQRVTVTTDRADEQPGVDSKTRCTKRSNSEPANVLGVAEGPSTSKGSSNGSIITADRWHVEETLDCIGRWSCCASIAIRAAAPNSKSRSSAQLLSAPLSCIIDAKGSGPAANSDSRKTSEREQGEDILAQDCFIDLSTQLDADVGLTIGLCFDAEIGLDLDAETGRLNGDAEVGLEVGSL